VPVVKVPLHSTDAESGRSALCTFALFARPSAGLGVTRDFHYGLLAARGVPDAAHA
jgi:hypothetical protein